MPDYLLEQMPDLMPAAMANLLPNMLPQIAPLLTPKMIDTSRRTKKCNYIVTRSLSLLFFFAISIIVEASIVKLELKIYREYML
jgi:hypothetical protein